MKAWHFLPEDRYLRWSRELGPVEPGWIYTAEGDLKMCNWGMHGSVKPLDALKYAPGPIVCRVELSGVMIHDRDKVCAQNREVLWMADATETLREFARWCALQVVHLWDCPEVVLDYLKTGDESKRDASWDAARAAARDAARAAAWDAAWAAAGDASWDAAWDAQNKKLATMLNRLKHAEVSGKEG
jgi:hypothetical protein